MKLELGRYRERVDARIAELSADGASEHIWARDAAFWGDAEASRKSVANRLGWLDVPSQMQQHLPDLQAFADDLRTSGFDACAVLGMGGSSLAPEVLRQSIRSMNAPRLHVLDTTDPATILDVERRINPARTLFFVSSKSGTTIEALSLFTYFHDIVAKTKGDAAGGNFVAVTDAATPLEALAREKNFRRIFTNPGEIGGRYSALSYFGLAPAAAAGVDVGKLLERGVRAARDATASDSEAFRLGAALGELALAGCDKVTFLVAPRVASFGLWVEQLIAESTGKHGRGIVPVAGEPFASPKHYGDDRVFVQLRLARDENGETDAVAGALAAEGHPVIVIDLEDAYDLGREFFRWEYAIAVAGHVLGINPFDEPNVQESKDNTKRVLQEFETSGKLDLDILTSRDEPAAVSPNGGVESSLDAALSTLLSALEPHDYFAITAYVEPTPAAADAFGAIRAAIRDETHAATTLGYGPRFLHSTGQLHKGGPPTGVFLQLTADDPRDIAIPGQPFSFGQLKRAQAIGDLESLAKHGRPALRVHLGREVDAGLERLQHAVRNALIGARKKHAEARR